MTHDEHATGRIDFRRRYSLRGHGGMRFLSPRPSHYKWQEALVLVVLGLLGGFGLGLAFAMLTLMDKI